MESSAVAKNYINLYILLILILRYTNIFLA